MGGCTHTHTHAHAHTQAHAHSDNLAIVNTTYYVREVVRAHTSLDLLYIATVNDPDKLSLESRHRLR